MKPHILALIAITIMMASCSNSGTNNPGNTNTDTSENSKRTLAAPITQSTTAANIAKEPIPPVKVEKLKIDLEKRRVFIPSDGWVSAEAFWEIYHNHPGKLPGDIDFDLLQKLKDLPELEPILANKKSDPKNESSKLITVSSLEEKKSHPADLSSHPAEVTNSLPEETPPPVLVIDNPAEDPIRLGQQTEANLTP